MLKVAMGSGASEVDEVAAEPVVDTDMVVEESELSVEMLTLVEVSALVLVVERTEVVSVEVEASSVDDVFVVVVSVEEVVLVTEPLGVDDVVAEEGIDSVEEEAELAEDVVGTDAESGPSDIATTLLAITCRM
ncbi:hypothetical protein CEP53_007689 [Fusarium sp. AF-6]|nr:hypothetical protein CEP53_007689 [Fusarium sp. AF-6]